MKSNKNIYLVFAVLGFLGVAFLFFSQKSNHENPTKVSFKDVDSLRKEAIVKNKFQREKMTVENFNKAPTLSNQYRPTSGAADHEEGLRLEASVSAAAKDIAEGELNSLSLNSLENKINQRLLNEQKTAQMNVLQKKRFADEYKKRAMAMGYAVELNDKLEIIKVQKVDAQPKQRTGSPVIDIDSMEEEEE
jgi:hypothetical protein